MFEEFNDKELMRLLWIAQETRDLKYYRQIKEEMNRRNSEL